MGAKDDLLKQTVEEFTTFKAAYAGLTEPQMTQAMLGTWSVREILGHVAGWHREMAPVLKRISRGEKPLPDGVSYDDVDGWNDRFVKANAGKSAAELLREVATSHEALVAAARLVPEERFAAGRAAARTLEEVGPNHYKEHGEQIRAWRRARGF